MNNAEKKTKKMSMAMKAAIIGAVAGIFMIGKSAISAAADMEMMTTQFEVMLGSTEKANAMMEKLKTFSASTPFALEDLAKGSQQLLSFGVAEDDVLKRMQMLGDMAGGNAEKLSGLVLAYGKVSVKGKASMEELNMIAEKGVPIYTTLSDQLGVTREQMFKMVSKGQISAADITESLQTMTTSGGMFFEGMKKQSMTFTGLISTMKDNFKLLLAEVGTAFLPIMKEIVQVITKLVQGPLGELIKVLLSSVMPIIKSLSELLEPLFAALIPVFTAISAVITPLLKIIMAVLLPIIKALLPLFTVLAKVLMIIGKVLKALTPLFDALGEIFAVLIEFVALILEAFMPLFMLLGEVVVILMKILNPVLKVLVFLLKKLSLGFTATINWIQDVIKWMAKRNKKANEFYAKLFKDMEKGISWLWEKFKWLLSKIGNALTWILDKILENFGTSLEEVGKIFNWIGEKFSWLMEKIENLFTKLLGIFGIKIGGKKKEEKITTIKVNPPSLGSTMQKGYGSSKSTSSTANINMTNNIGVSGGGTGSKRGAEKVMKEAARSVFTIELQKILVNAGY